MAIPNEILTNFELVFGKEPDVYRLWEIVDWYGQEEIELALQKLLTRRKQHRKYRNPYGLLIVISRDFSLR